MLNHPYFYNEAIKKIVTVFGTLFNDIDVTREGPTNSARSIQRVPIAYGPRAKFLERARQERDLESDKLAIKLPRMSFEILSLSPDTSVKLNRSNFYVGAQGTQGVTAYMQCVPYLLGIQLNIIGKEQSDVLQILEQILPYFNPDFVVSIKGLETPDSSTDVRFTLNGVSMSDEYEGDFVSRRAVIYTLDFNIPVKFYGYGIPKKLILSSEVDLNVDGTDVGSNITATGTVDPLSVTITITDNFGF